MENDRKETGERHKRIKKIRVCGIFRTPLKVKNKTFLSRSISLRDQRMLFRDEPRLLPFHEQCHG